MHITTVASKLGNPGAASAQRALATVCLGLLFSGQIFAQCVKSVRWSDDPPYSYKLPTGEISGFSVDLLRAVLKGMNCEARFVELPWARALRELEQGRLDILPGALRTPATRLDSGHWQISRASGLGRCGSAGLEQSFVDPGVCQRPGPQPGCILMK